MFVQALLIVSSNKHKRFSLERHINLLNLKKIIKSDNIDEELVIKCMVKHIIQLDLKENEIISICKYFKL